MRFLVLGSGGKLGKLLRERWPSSDDLVPIWHGGPTDELRFDIVTDTAALQAAVDASDAVLLLAGVTGETGLRPLSTNTSVARAVIARAGLKPVFCCSTAAVYGRTAGRLGEDSPLAPVSAYGASKRDMEHAVRDQPNAFVLRIGNVAGADALLGIDRPSYMLTEFPDGSTPIRSFIGPGLLARVFTHLARRALDGRSLPRVLNVAGPTPMSMAALLEAAGKAWMPKPAGPENIKKVELDTSALWQLWDEPAPLYGPAEIFADLERRGAQA